MANTGLYPAELGPRTRRFLDYMNAESPVFFSRVLKTAQSHPAVFGELAEEMLGWANALLGEESAKPLVNGYMSFVIDVNRAQALYEKRGRYEYSSYADASAQVYDNDEFMSEYHWGVYVTTFAWEHHLRIYSSFNL